MADRGFEAAQAQLWARAWGIEGAIHEIESDMYHSPNELVVVRKPVGLGPSTYSYSYEKNPDSLFFPRLSLRYGKEGWEAFTLRNDGWAIHAPLPGKPELDRREATYEMAEYLGEMLLLLDAKNQQLKQGEPYTENDQVVVELFGAGVR